MTDTAAATPVYEMDAETYETLYRWMAHNAPLGTSIIDECDAVVTFLQSLDAEDAAYFMEKGWGRCYKLAQECAPIRLDEDARREA